MRQEKNILHGIEFTDIGENRSRCEFCHEYITEVIFVFTPEKFASFGVFQVVIFSIVYFTLHKF